VQRTFTINELVRLFRESLVALLPVMDAAGISWRPPATYDPWENIETALYDSIVGSCVENVIGLSRPGFGLAKYGFYGNRLEEHVFLGARSPRLAGTPNAFVELVHSAPDAVFDRARFEKLDAGFRPTGSCIDLSLEECQLELADVHGDIPSYMDEITFID